MSRPPFDIDHFAYRVIRDAMLHAEPAHWRRRAAAWRAVQWPAGHPRAARVETIVANLEHRATICDLTEHEEQLILDEIDRCSAVHRYMQQVDDVTSLEQLRVLWKRAAAEGRLDPGYATYDILVRHFDRVATALTRQAAA